MACATFTGAAGLLENSELSAAEWRANVTSKGGTTEAAMKELEKCESLVDAALEAAKKHCEDLNK